MKQRATELKKQQGAAETAATLRDGGKSFYRATDIRLRGVLALLRHDPRVQQFVESEPASLLTAEARGQDGQLELLAKYLESGGNKAAMTRSGYLSRPTLYARLAKLEELLAVDTTTPNPGAIPTRRTLAAPTAGALAAESPF